MRRLLAWALDHRLAVLAATCLVIGYGAWSWIVLRKEAYPDVGDTQVLVITQQPGRAAEEVEQQVTIPIERALNGVPRVINRRSKTIFGLSVVQLTFEDGVEDYWARQRVLEKLGDADLPNGITPSLGPLTGPVGEIYRYVLEGPPEMTPMDLRTLQDWVVVPALLQVPGVADVVNFGGLVKQFHVVTSPERLLRYRVTLQQVMDAIVANNANVGGNVVRRGGQGFVVRGVGAIRHAEDIARVVITATNGVPVLVRDVATVEPFPSPPTGILSWAVRDSTGHLREGSGGIQGLVAMRRGENPSETVTLVKARVDELNARGLPKGVHLTVSYDRSDLVRFTIHTVVRTLFEGFSLVLIVLVFFIGSVRSALVVACTIPVAMLFAFATMHATGIPANLLSLGAVDFGIIVDGAVVMVENLMRRYAHATEAERALGLVALTRSAAQEVGREIFFSISIIILAYLPIFTLQRVEGRLFRPMAFTLGYAVGGSLLLAITTIPVLMSFLYQRWFAAGARTAIEWHNPVYAALERWYARTVARLIARPLLTTSVALTGVVVLTIAAASRVGTQFLPELDEGAFNIRLFFPVGIALDESARALPRIKQALMAHPQVRSVLAQLGRNDDGTDPYGPNRLEILVGLAPYDAWPGDTSKVMLLGRMKRELETAVPGALVSFSQPILDNVTEAVTGSVADLAVLVGGDDLATLRHTATTILQRVATIRGATEYGIEQEGDQAQLSIEVDREAAARFGINVADVQRLIESAIGGQPVSTLYDGARRFDIVVRYQRDLRASVPAISSLEIVNPAGQRVPLSQVASIALRDGPTIIQREDGVRQVSVRTNIRGRDQGSFAAEAQAVVARQVHVPDGYTVRFGGQYENLARAARRLAIVIPLTVTIIFALLYSLYRNARHVVVAMSCIPFAVVGGVLALAARGYEFDVSAGVGFVSLFGISVMSGVLFVSRANKLREDRGLDIIGAALEASVVQLRPRLMTILLALLGLIPAARHFGVGSDVQRPLATVIVGGLASKLVLGLLALPAVYLVMEWSAWRTAQTDRALAAMTAPDGAEGSPFPPHP